jgi:alkanesulfonate monooxygenase SsuD/methylene tetrahydromethanopterin reductase-like flavin-dependent oxidoreductase (luciferase family)
MILGVGTGWLDEEFNLLGADFANRGQVTTETLILVRRMWTENHITYNSEHFQISDYTLQPKPHQRPHPPIYVGGGSRRAFRRLAEHADGWIAPSAMTAEDLAQGVQVLTDYWRQGGRAGRPRVVAELNMAIGTSVSESQKEVEAWHASFHRQSRMPILSGSNAPTVVRSGAIGPAELGVEMIRDLVAAGADEVMCRFIAFDWQEQFALLARDILPHVAEGGNDAS